MNNNYTPSWLGTKLMNGTIIAASACVAGVHGVIGFADSGCQIAKAGATKLASDTRDAAKSGYHAAKARFSAKRETAPVIPSVMPSDLPQAYMPAV